jgi:hypothetical protein
MAQSVSSPAGDDKGSSPLTSAAFLKNCCTKKLLFLLLKATPHKDRLSALLHIYLNIFRHLAQKFLDIRQYACEISIQSDEKSCYVSAQQSSCGVALKN